jgi:isoleucyl-tRNA synthetase
MHVRSSKPRDLELLRTKFASEQILDELNVKSFGSLGADDRQLCRLTAKANFKVLGKRLGPRMKAAAAAIEALSTADLGRLRAGESVQPELEGEPITIAPEDVLIQVESQADFDVETDGRFVVWLDTALDPELIAEGLAREAVNRINGLRKERELAIEDRIRLELFHFGDATLTAALERHRGFIAAETLAVEIVIAAEPARLDEAESFDLGDAKRLGVRIARA